MSYGVCHLSVVPVRAGPSDKTEMVTQLLFGEAFRIIAEEEKWVKISCAYDGYEGWIDRKQYADISEDYFKRLEQPHAVSLDAVQVAYNDRRQLLLTAGSILPDFVESGFSLNGEKFNFNGLVSDPEQSDPDMETLMNLCKSFLNVPYLWGGRTPFGIDCSGLTQVIFRMMQLRLPRDAHQQAGQGDAVNDVSHAQIGDLAFFHNGEGKIVHTGILLEEGRILHASGWVRIDRLDAEGIINADKNLHTHKLAMIKRVLKFPVL